MRIKGWRYNLTILQIEIMLETLGKDEIIKKDDVNNKGS